MKKKGTPLKSWDININYGIKTGLNEAFIIDKKTRDELLNSCQNLDEKEKTSNLIKPILRGRDIKRYSYEWANLWLICTFPALNLDIENYPSLKKFLMNFMPRLKQSGEKGCRKKTSNKWFETQDNIAYYKEFEKDKIFYNEIGNGINFYYTKYDFYCNNKLYFITLKKQNEQILKYFLVLLNSSLFQNHFKNIFNFGGGKGVDSFENIKIPQIPADKMSEFENLANELLNLNENLKTTKNAFLTELNLDKLPKTLENFELLEFDEFIDEFTKALKLKFKDKLDERNFKNQWERIFMHDKNEVLNLQSKISKLDKNADDLVYKLFDLSNDEIKFIENEMR